MPWAMDGFWGPIQHQNFPNEGPEEFGENALKEHVILIFIL
jgi:hypothetical protein